jgi:hypothetical protein
MNEVFMSRQPLVNRQSRIIATRLTLHLGNQGGMQAAVSTLDALSDVWPPGEKPVFISCGQASCDASLLDWSAPQKRDPRIAGSQSDQRAGPGSDRGAADLATDALPAL